MKHLLILFFSVCTFSAFSQNDTLELYTQQGCGYCKWTKEVLTKSSIAFSENDLADDILADKMLKRLAAAGYKGTIHLPVIFLNDSLILPAMDTTISLQKIVNILVMKQKNGTLHFAKSKLTIEQLTTATNTANNDCVLRNGEPQYVIIQYEFDDKQQASNKLNELYKQGYTFAGMVQFQAKYRIYSQIFTTEEEANAVLPNVQKKFPVAYVYVIQ